MCECAFNLQATAADIGHTAGLEPYNCSVRKTGSRFQCVLFVDQDLARHDKGLGLLTVVGQPTLHQKDVAALFQRQRVSRNAAIPINVEDDAHTGWTSWQAYSVS